MTGRPLKRQTVCSRLAAFAFALVVWPSSVSAHQPQIVQPSPTPIPVRDAEIPKAYYAALDGAPQLFEVRCSRPFILYVSILVPGVPGVARNLSAEIRDGKHRFVAELDGLHARWKKFHKPSGGDDYYQGPEFRGRVPAGTYAIKVIRPGNRGKYVLAVGEREEFTFRETLRTLRVLPRLKSDFFGKSP